MSIYIFSFVAFSGAIAEFRNAPCYILLGGWLTDPFNIMMAFCNFLCAHFQSKCIFYQISYILSFRFRGGGGMGGRVLTVFVFGTLRTLATTT